MTGRGIDQIQRHPGDPRLFESYVTSARRYVEIAEEANGPIPREVDPGYVWGDALSELQRARPNGRIVNLETAVTTSTDAWPGKGIHYRMHPANVACLTAAAIDCCTLANNHVLDWGYDGLVETLAELHAAGIRTAGAGRNAVEAAAPAVIESGAGRVLVFAYGSPSSGVPKAWAARGRCPGINLLDEFDAAAVERVARDVRNAKRAGDLVVASIHLGSNWGHEVPRGQRSFTRQLVDDAGVDVVCGHSSHHPRPLELHGDRLILHGCGDFLNDYEGIRGYESFRPELGFMYLPEFEHATGRLLRLVLVPVRVRRFRVQRASAEESAWLQETMNAQGRAFGTRLAQRADGTLEVLAS